MMNRPKPTHAAEQDGQPVPVDRAVDALRIRQLVDDLAEQDRLDELRGGERDAGDCQDPAQPGLGPQYLKDANVETEEFHGAAQQLMGHTTM